MTGDLTAERLRELLDYDPATGAFTRRVNLSNVKAGSIAGRIGLNGYHQISVDNRRYLAHRLAWLHVHGVWPEGHLDHINGWPTDNRLVNLRTATDAENAQNRRKSNPSSTSGFLGVGAFRGRWRAQIMVDRRNRHLGCFDTPEQAHEAYLAAKRDLHPFWAAGREDCDAA